MIGKQVGFKLPERFGGSDVVGVVKNVIRDVLSREITIVLNKKRSYVFREPSNILAMSEDNIVMAYGEFSSSSDDDFFEELHNVAEQGLGVDDAMKSLEQDVLLVSFHLSDPPSRKGRRSSFRKKKKKNKES